MYHYVTSGLNNIWLANGYEIIHDDVYGECVSITNVKGLNRAIGHGLIHNKPKFTGTEFRFLRKEMNLSQPALADLIGNDEQAVARWEKTSKIPKWADRLMRLLVQDYYGESGARALIDHVRDLDHFKNEKIVFEEEKAVWKQAA